MELRNLHKKALATSLGLALCCGQATAANWLDNGPVVAGSALSISPMPITMMNGLAYGGMKLGSWRDYTRQALMPDFSITLGFHYEFDLGLLANHEHLLVPGFAMLGAPETSTRFILNLNSGVASLTPLAGTGQIEHSANGLAIDRVLFSPGLRQQIADDAVIDVAAVFANQRFASWGMGSWVADGSNEWSPYNFPGAGDGSSGTGVRFAFSSELAPGVAVDAGYQSRIDMDSFQSYRGVYSEPGDFDIPASATVGLVLRSGERSSFRFDVQRVLYSDVNAFTTNALPDSFLSLLGDAGSPSFDWEDLTIYSVGWNYRMTDALDWRVQYSTGQQPSPTSDILYQALEPEIADSNVSVGFSRWAGRSLRVDFDASYAPSEYFLGPVNLGRAAEIGEDQFEVELKLIWQF
ncbi:MAG: hypothetical protein AAGE01_03885 [Pseudomonadota bacterium]